MAETPGPGAPAGVEVAFICPHCRKYTTIWSPIGPYYLQPGAPLACAHCNGLTMLQLEVWPRAAPET